MIIYISVSKKAALIANGGNTCLWLLSTKG